MTVSLFIKRPAAVATALLLTGSVLTACGEDQKAATPEPTKTVETTPTAAPSPEQSSPEATPSANSSTAPTGQGKTLKAGETFRGDGFSFVVPEGWETTAKPPPGTQVALALRGDPSSNMNVVSTSAGSFGLDELLPQMKKQLELQVDGMKDTPRQKINGVEVGGITGKTRQGGFGLTQMYVVKNGKIHIITALAIDKSKDPAMQAGLTSLVGSFQAS